jgi:hypothetical protein
MPIRWLVPGTQAGSKIYRSAWGGLSARTTTGNREMMKITKTAAQNIFMLVSFFLILGANQGSRIVTKKEAKI